jgi:hypothetical protein
MCHPLKINLRLVVVGQRQISHLVWPAQGKLIQFKLRQRDLRP